LGQYVVKELLAHGHAVVSLDLTKPQECVCPTLALDLTKPEALLDHCKDVDAVVHLARNRFPYTETGFNTTSRKWEFADMAGDAGRFNQNVAMTENVLAAAEARAIKKIVCGSSLAAYGLYYPSTELKPEYLPVDEEHPLRPQDPYGLTKLIGETLCAALARRSGAGIASLRFAGVYTEAHYPMLRERKTDPLIRGTGALWSYIDARDAARACRLALEANFDGHHAFNICAPTTIMDTPTRELVRRYLPQVKRVREDLEGNWCGYDPTKAAAMLGFQARHLLLNAALQ
jgi:nucleoside-diphosphate-sugar epimerase